MNKYQEWLKQGHILQITADGLFVAGKPAVTYNNEKILMPVVDALGTDFQEIQVMQSVTKGAYTQSGNPTPGKDSYLWLRANSTNGIWSDWLCRWAYVGLISKTELAASIAKVASVLQDKIEPDFREAVLKNISKKNQLANIIGASQQSKTK